MLETDRPIALREAIMACRNGGTVSVIGVYGGFIDKFPMGSVMNRSLTIKTGQCHVQRYMKPLLGAHPAGRDRPQLRHHPPPAARGRARGLRHVPEEARRLREGGAHAVSALSPLYLDGRRSGDASWSSETSRSTAHRGGSATCAGPRRTDRSRTPPTLLVTRLPHDPAGRAAEIRPITPLAEGLHLKAAPRLDPRGRPRKPPSRRPLTCRREVPHRPPQRFQSRHGLNGLSCQR